MSKSLSLPAKVERDLAQAIDSLQRVAAAIAAFEPSADNVDEARKIVGLAQATAKLAATVKGAKELHCKSGELIVDSTTKLAEAEALERKARPKGGNRGNQHTGGKVSGAVTLPAAQRVAESKRAPLHKLPPKQREAYFAACRKAETPPTVTGATTLARLPEPQRKEVLAKLGDVPDVKKAIAEVKRAERVEKITEIAKGNKALDLPQRFAVIYADPPWRYEHSKTDSRKIENHYPTMDLDAICDLPVATVSTDDAILFLWATSPKLAEAMRVVESWGFTYRTSMVWVKASIGMGYYARQRHELLLIATKGKPPAPLPAARPDSVQEAPKTAHSAKPALFAELIERMYPKLPRVELFCRSPRDGWHVWGNQA